MASTARKRRIETSAGRKMAAVLDGLYSADEEEDLDTDMHSPTDGSEDSVDVKVKPIGTFTSSCKSKRKCAEPRKFAEEVKKRNVDFHHTENENGPFRPWSQEHPSSPPCGYIPAGYPVTREQRESTGPAHCDQEQPLSLVLRDVSLERTPPAATVCTDARPGPGPQEVVRLPQDPARAFSVESLICTRPGTSSSTSSVTDKRKSLSGQSQQRNYKNMTRERRVEANARERTRVHTISAAFDTLRRAVPAYSHNQKLSKLSVLRIACSYILTLSRVAGRDYSEDGSQPPLADCVDNVTRTIQMEGKLRKKKDD